MAPEVRKYHINASKKGSPDQHSYVGHHFSKVPQMISKTSKGIKRCVVQLNSTIKTMSTIKMIKKNRIRTMKTTIVLYFKRGKQKIHKSIGDTIYADETKI